MGRLFGTNGVRGIVGDLMTPELALRLGRSCGTIMGGPFLVGTDTRTSGPVMKGAFIAGLRSCGVDVVDCGIVPTPALQYGILTGKYAGGAVITASHNPPEHNGIKVILGDGKEADHEVEGKIEDAYFEEKFTPMTYRDIGAESIDMTVAPRYVEACLSHVDVEAIRRAKLKVVMDVANGAGVTTGPQAMSKLGVKLITLNAQPDGTFPGHPSEPTAENLVETFAAAKAIGADLITVLDGDADRCVLGTNTARYVPGEQSLTLAAYHHVKEHGGGVVTTAVSTGMAMEDAVKSVGGEVEYTAVGSPIIARAMPKSKAVFGGEENGGLIFPQHQYARDGTMTAVWTAHLIATTGSTLDELLAPLPKYAMVKAKVKCTDAQKPLLLDALVRVMEQEGGGEIDRTDGMRVNRDDGWILVRPSGTEPIFRVFAESKDEATAKKLSAWALEKVKAALKGL